jgi:hypothetical protein
VVPKGGKNPARQVQLFYIRIARNGKTDMHISGSRNFLHGVADTWDWEQSPGERELRDMRHR